VKLPPGTPYRSKTDLALELIDQVQSWEVPARPLVGDSFYGNEFGVRQALRQWPLAYGVEVEPRTSVWTEDPNLPLPPKKTGRPRQYPPLEALPRPRNLQLVAQALPAAAWPHVTWRQGRRGRNARGLTCSRSGRPMGDTSNNTRRGWPSRCWWNGPKTPRIP
jgi:SRSO17 transposase